MIYLKKTAKKIVKKTVKKTLLTSSNFFPVFLALSFVVLVLFVLTMYLTKGKFYCVFWKKTATVAIPKTLSSCPAKYFEKDAKGAYKINCDWQAKVHVCSYYSASKGCSKADAKLEYNNECLACRFYGETGIKEANDITYKQYGYQTGVCK